MLKNIKIGPEMAKLEQKEEISISNSAMARGEN